MNTQRKKILIIEDDEALQKAYAQFFEQTEYETVVSRDGLVGITELVEMKPDVVVLDLVMPEMDGYAFLEALKNNTSISVPVIVLSNLSEQEAADKALAAGADRYLMKANTSQQQLLEAVEEMLAPHSHASSQDE